MQVFEDTRGISLGTPVEFLGDLLEAELGPGLLTSIFDGLQNPLQGLADVSGSAVVDIWKDTYANYPPLNADSITASAVPTISTAVKSQDATLTGWTTSIVAGDILAFNVDSVTTIKQLTVSLKCTK